MDSIDHLSESHVQKMVFGVSLHDAANEVSVRGSRDSVPAAFSAPERTAVQQATQHPGEILI